MALGEEVASYGLALSSWLPAPSRCRTARMSEGTRWDYYAAFSDAAAR